jgi:hypothetical protein
MASSVVRIRVPTFDVVYEVFTMGGPACRYAIADSRADLLVDLGGSLSWLARSRTWTGHVRTKRVTVETCGDLRAIRPLTEGQPSTEFALQADPVPSNVNGYPSVACMSITFELPLQCGVEAMDAW